MTEINTVVF